MLRFSVVIALMGCTQSSFEPTPASAMMVSHSGHTGLPPASGYGFIRRIRTPATPSAAHFGIADDEIYALHRNTGGGGDGLFQLSNTGWSLLQGYDNPASILPTPDGAILVSEDYGGNIYRYHQGSSSVWVSGLHSGDDDPMGMAFAPADYAGGLVPPLGAVVADQGNNGEDEVWAFSTTTSEGETVLHDDNGTLVSAWDVAIGEEIWVLDTQLGGAAIIYELGAGGSLTPMVTNRPIMQARGMAYDPNTGMLLVAENATTDIVQIDPTTGEVTTLIDLDVTLGNITPIDIHPVSGDIVVTTASDVLLFGNCEPNGDDCDANGVADRCDIAQAPELDCDRNAQIDSCELASGAPDCDDNGILDVCPDCPPLELIFIMDTSSSMEDEGRALCAELDTLEEELANTGIILQAQVLSLDHGPSTNFPCVDQSVADAYGTAMPGNPPADLSVFGACPGGIEVQSEDWARGTGLVAGLHPWAAGSTRVIVPMFDEGPYCGDPVSDLDTRAVTEAITVASASGVRVYPITATGSSASVVAEAQRLADGTAGALFSSGNPSSGLLPLLLDVGEAACRAEWDCNENLIPDACEIDLGDIDDCDGDGIPDICDLDDLPDVDGDGICDGEDLCEGDNASGDTDADGVCDDIDPCFGADPVDTDGDGLCDDIDPCPDDALDDSDMDGSCDGDDLCVGDDTTGDADRDGLCDERDPCFGPDNMDADGDGFCDSEDRCVGDDATGDLDGDGVCDSDDICFGDDAEGDSDQDGFCDDVDICTGNDATGDTDTDGVCNDEDLCFGNDAAGDTDQDGICDDEDLCTGDDASGDTDRDGTCDDEDACFGDDAAGDTDQDGICDDEDLCTGDDASGDTDQDGICDDEDACFGDDATGDTDGDGICDSDDLCIGDDATGDTNGDGICDSNDACVGDDATGDTDGDGVCDSNDACTGDDATGDTDGDGICDSDDACIGDDATGDTDGDGICDSDDPCPTGEDSDGDTICDAEDLCIGTDATGDSDGDGICDDQDECIGDDATGDADGDGLCEDEETALGTSDTATDTDNDGLDDLVEEDWGTDPTVADTDGDGLLDGEEALDHGTDPTNADTDGDNLPDGAEIDLGTDPTDPDTDDGGVLDGVEVDNGTDPTFTDDDIAKPEASCGCSSPGGSGAWMFLVLAAFVRRSRRD